MTITTMTMRTMRTGIRSSVRQGVCGVVVALAGFVPSAALAQDWTTPRTPWGDPDLQGVFTNKDEANTPLERPDGFEGRKVSEVSPRELADLVRNRQVQHDELAPTLGGAETGAGPIHWFETFQTTSTLPWLVIDPPDGKIPPMTPEAQARERAVARLTEVQNGQGRADSFEDRSMYDRCITRGLPQSMMPAIYGNAYQILQSPGFVAIRYEMIHETRIIPLDGRDRIGDDIRLYVGDARGRWEGDTLVVDTTNFTNRTHFGYNNRYNSERLHLTERFTRVSPETVRWEVTVEDPQTYTGPWTFAMPLTQDESQPVFEYACHEGNYGLSNLLSAARAQEAGR